jgi:hypothetical protein
LSKFAHVTNHPLYRLLERAGLKGDARYDLHRLLVAAARDGLLEALLRPRGERPAIIGYHLWSAYQTRSGEAPRRPSGDFDNLPYPQRQPWIVLAEAMLPILAAEVLG